MSIKKFEQFINENVSEGKSKIFKCEIEMKRYDIKSIHTINDVREQISNLFDRAQQRLDIFRNLMSNVINGLEDVVSDIMEELNDIIIGEPEIHIDDVLDCAEVTFATDFSYSDYINTENKLSDVIDSIIEKYKNLPIISIDVCVSKDGGFIDKGGSKCFIKVYMSLINKENDYYYSNVVYKLGEE